MSLIKKVDVDKHFAARRAMQLGRTGPLSRASARMAPAATAKNALAPIQVDAMGDSSPKASVTSIADHSGAAGVPTVLRNRQP